MPSAKDIDGSTEFIKAMVVGPPGSGKSIFASSFPTPGYVFDLSKGILSYRGLDFDYDQFPISPEGWVLFEKTVGLVKKRVEAGELVTVILDDTTGWMDIAMERAMQLDPKRSPTGGPIWNVHYMMVRHLLEGKMRQLINLNCNLVIIAHMDVIKDEETGAVLEVKPLLTGQLSIRAPGYFDEVYFTSTRKSGDNIQWLIQTVPIGFKNARSRLSGKARLLPDFLPNNYQELVKHLKIKKATQKTI
jgi:hypothetical protein